MSDFRMAFCPYCGTETPAQYGRDSAGAICPCGAREMDSSSHVRLENPDEEDFQTAWVREALESEGAPPYETAIPVSYIEARTGWFKPTRKWD